MNYKYLNLRIENRVGWIEYNRPPINAFNWDMLREVPAALEELLQNQKTRVIVFSSAIEKYFSTGADLRVFDGISTKEMGEWVSICHGLVTLMRQASKPLLAAIRGIATGGGLEMVLHCDIRFAASDARLGQPEINIIDWMPGWVIVEFQSVFQRDAAIFVPIHVNDIIFEFEVVALSQHAGWDRN